MFYAFSHLLNGHSFGGGGVRPPHDFRRSKNLLHFTLNIVFFSPSRLCFSAFIMIVREIVERPMGTSSPPVPPQPPKPSGSRKYGFPLAKRRPMSASDKSSNVSIVNQDSQPESGPSQPGPSTSRNEANKVRAEMDRENTRRIEAMGEQERQDEVQELEGRFGASTLAAFRRRAKKRIQSNQAVSSIPGPSRSSSAAPKAEADKLRTEVEMENIRRVEAMDDLEREEEIRELEERFGQETLIALRRRAERRKRDPSEHGPNLAESSATAACMSFLVGTYMISDASFSSTTSKY